MKILLCSLLLSLAATSWAVAAVVNETNLDRGWDLGEPVKGLSFRKVEAVYRPGPDKPAQRLSRLRRVAGQGSGHRKTSSALGRLLRPPPTRDQQKQQNITKAGDYSTQYAIQCGWDGQPVWLLFDTGSSDTWAVRKGFVCRDEAGQRHDEAACGFGRPLVGDFGEGAIDGLHLHLQYGSGEEVSGPMGYSDLSCGGVSVSSQQVALVNHSYWHGNNLTVGVLGLAYPSITSGFYGQLGEEATWNAVSYTPFLTKAIAQGAMEALFSVALEKNSSEGLLAWGGLPPVDWRRGRSAATDLIIANLAGQAETSWRYSFYTIIPDGIRWGQTVDRARYPYIVDTGTTMNYLPPPLAEAIAMAFQPEAVYLYQWGAYFAPCDAVPPSFGVIISGVEFAIRPGDLMYRDLVDPLTGYCAIAIASGGAGPYILGDVFLQNVVAVFDVGGGQMRFYSRRA